MATKDKEMAERQEEIIKKFDEIKSTLEGVKKQEMIDRQRNQMLDDAQKRLARRADVLDDMTHGVDDRGQRKQHLELASEKAEQELKQAASTINDYRNAMSSLALIYISLNKGVTALVLSKIHEFQAGRTIQKIKDKEIEIKEPIELPKLVHNVHFKDGKVKIDKLVRPDNQLVVKEINDAFGGFVNAWLAKCGYTPSAAKDGTYQDHTGRVLDEHTFASLKNGTGHHPKYPEIQVTALAKELTVKPDVVFDDVNRPPTL